MFVSHVIYLIPNIPNITDSPDSKTDANYLKTSHYCILIDVYM